MDDAKVGSAFRAVRIRAGLTQVGIARSASVRPSDVSHLERGLVDELTIHVLRRIAAVAGMRVELLPRWRGVELDRLVNSAHAELQRAVLAWLARRPGWVVLAEVTYSIFGERGAIDLLGWHEATRTVLVIELKTLIVDAAEIEREMDRRTRLALEIAAQQGWHAETVARWVVVTDTRTNRRHVERFAAILRRPSTIDGRTMRAWLRSPRGPVVALSFWPEPKARIRSRVRASRSSPGRV
jgi:transcriptional regulator with XRE-family HTH domain